MGREQEKDLNFLDGNCSFKMEECEVKKNNNIINVDRVFISQATSYERFMFHVSTHTLGGGGEEKEGERD